MFQMTFSEEEIPMEITRNNNAHTCSVLSPSSLCCKSKVSCWYYLCCYKWKKKLWKQNFVFLCLFFFCSFAFQETDPFDQVNLVIPGSLLPFKKEIVYMFEKEKKILFRRSRYAKVFRDTSISAIFANRRNLKNLVVQTKVAWKQKLWVDVCIFKDYYMLGRKLFINRSTQGIHDKYISKIEAQTKKNNKYAIRVICIVNSW